VSRAERLGALQLVRRNGVVHFGPFRWLSPEQVDPLYWGLLPRREESVTVEEVAALTLVWQERRVSGVQNLTLVATHFRHAPLLALRNLLGDFALVRLALGGRLGFRRRASARHRVGPLMGDLPFLIRLTALLYLSDGRFSSNRKRHIAVTQCR
jgi:hypothetical protein